jgi:hypothetical protein
MSRGCSRTWYPRDLPGRHFYKNGFSFFIKGHRFFTLYFLYILSWIEIHYKYYCFFIYSILIYEPIFRFPRHFSGHYKGIEAIDQQLLAIITFYSQRIRINCWKNNINKISRIPSKSYILYNYSITKPPKPL